jgi:hypothetical protein
MARAVFNVPLYSMNGQESATEIFTSAIPKVAWVVLYFPSGIVFGRLHLSRVSWWRMARYAKV